MPRVSLAPVRLAHALSEDTGAADSTAREVPRSAHAAESPENGAHESRFVAPESEHAASNEEIGAHENTDDPPTASAAALTSRDVGEQVNVRVAMAYWRVATNPPIPNVTVSPISQRREVDMGPVISRLPDEASS